MESGEESQDNFTYFIYNQFESQDHSTIDWFFKIYFPVLVIVGVLVFVGLVTVLTRSAIFQQYAVSIYLIGISIAGIILLLVRPGVGWIWMITATPTPYPLWVFTCKLSPFLKTAGSAFINWILVFALIERFLAVKKSTPRPALCSHIGAKVTTVVIIIVWVAISLPYIFNETATNGRCEPWSWLWYDIYSNVIICATTLLPILIILVMCFVVGCSKNIEWVPSEKVIIEQQLCRFIVVMSAIHIVKEITDCLITELVTSVHDTDFDSALYIDLVISAFIGFAMVPALRQELKSSIKKSDRVEDPAKNDEGQCMNLIKREDP